MKWGGCLNLMVLLGTIALANAIVDLAMTPICLMHMHDGSPSFREYGAISLQNKIRYAERHGYEMAYHAPKETRGLFVKSDCDAPNASRRHDGECYVDNSVGYHNDRRAATFGKIKLAQHACVGRPDYWLLWMDADALIVNQTIKLEDSIIDDRYDFILTKDWLMLNAGMLLLKCSDWTIAFLKKVYDAEEYNRARALDQTSFQDHLDGLDEGEAAAHVKFIPKWAMNVYTEEYRPGDFLLHMAGKLYEAKNFGAVAIMRQFDTLSLAENVEDISAFFSTPYVLNAFSGTCDVNAGNGGSDCPPEDPRRMKLPERLLDMSTPNRYRHVGERYYWLGKWADIYDLPDWNNNRQAPKRFETIPKQPLDEGNSHDEL